MALKTLELRNKIDTAKAEQVRAAEKLAEIRQRRDTLAEQVRTATEEEVEPLTIQADEITKEIEEAEKKESTIKAEVELLERELAELEQAQPSSDPKPEERKLDKMENIELRNTKKYIDAYANYIKTNDDTEVRSLLTENVEGGALPVPAIVMDYVKTAWEREEIMSLVRKTYLKGNVKQGFEISATGAVVHTEGAAAPAEETLTLGIVTMVPRSIKKWITVSDEAMDLSGADFLRYIYDELTYQIAKKAADMTVEAIANAPTVSTATAAGQDAITAAPALGTVADALGHLSDEAANPVIIMNKGTWAAFKAIQYNANYAADPFEGLKVVFNNSLPAYSAASAGNVYMIVGDLGHGAQANFPSGQEIAFTFDPYSLSEKDLVKIVGRMYVGLGVVAPKAFTNVKKPS